MPRPLIEEEGKRYSLSARTTLELNLALKEAAKKNGRSVAQEIELRLEKSFEADRFERELGANAIHRAIDKDTDGMLKSMTAAIGATMLYQDAPWSSDIYARAAVKAAVDTVRSSYFSSRKLQVSYDEVDPVKLENAAKIGTFYGRLVAIGGDSPEGREWVKGLAARAACPLAGGDEDDDHISRVRRSAAVDELNGVSVD